MRRLLVIRRKGRIKMKSRSVLQLQYEDEEGKTVVREYPVRDLDAVLVLGGGLYIESSAVSALSSMNVPVAVVARDSVGVLLNPVIVASPNYRRLQYTIDRARALEIALEYIKSKVGGMINVLKYHGAGAPEVPGPPAPAGDPEEFEREIRSWESRASNALWDRLVLLLRPQVLGELRARYGFLGRRPGRPDPFNKTLSVMYAVLYALGTRALLAAGLDPTYGFLHRTRYGTPLTFDYAEMFKPVAVEATISALNSGGLPRARRGRGAEEGARQPGHKGLVRLLDARAQGHGEDRLPADLLKSFLPSELPGGQVQERVANGNVGQGAIPAHEGEGLV